MNILESIILGILQGITEFLPISSSGHLIIGEHILGLKVEELKSFDISLHLGSLLAILVYFRKDIGELLKAFFLFIVGKRSFYDQTVKLIFYIILGTIPAIFVGVLFGDYIDSVFRNPHTVAILMIVVGVWFLIAEWIYKNVKSKEIGWRQALIMGVFQAAALVPGVSRSGGTISAGLAQGIKREEAARFSFLLGIPAILGGGVLTFFEGGFTESVALLPITIGFLTSFGAGILSITFLMKFLKNHTLLIFAIYRIFIGFIGIF